MLRLVSWIDADTRGVSQEMPLRQALKTFEQGELKGLPVVDAQGRAVGFLHRSRSARWLHREQREGQAAEAMSPTPLILNPEAGLADALGLMWESEEHSVLTLDADGCPAGVLTSRAVLSGMRQSPLMQDLMNTPLSEFWHAPVARVVPEDSLAEFLELECEGSPVVDPDFGELVGYVSQSDVARMLWSSRRCLRECKVLDAMTACCHTCLPGARVAEAVELMVEHRIHGVVVAEYEQPVARLSALDVIYEIWRVLMDHSGAMPLKRRKTSTNPIASIRQAG
ncbi:CBS domain-containing protein [bacterium]|nr:CBS domain-containing protein [bacterium]